MEVTLTEAGETKDQTWHTTWAEYIQSKLFALFVFSEQSRRVHQENDAKTGLEEQAQQSSFPHPPQKKPFSP